MTFTRQPHAATDHVKPLEKKFSIKLIQIRTPQQYRLFHYRD